MGTGIGRLMGIRTLHRCKPLIKSKNYIYTCVLERKINLFFSDSFLNCSLEVILQLYFGHGKEECKLSNV